MRIAFGLCLLALGCGTPEPTATSERRYVLEVDLRPTIAQLAAEEQVDIDAAVETLAGYGDPVVPVLERALASEPLPVQLAVVDVLAQMETERASTLLIAVASRPGDAELRATALLRLGEAAWAPARPALEAALSDPSDMVSQTAAVACGRLCTSPAAIDRIADMAMSRVPDVEFGRVRATLAGIVSGPDATAAGHARDAIRARTAPALAGDTSADARARAALLAADAGVPDVEPVLVAVAAESKNVVLRSAVLQWLGKNGGAAAVPVVEAALHDATVRPAAALTLRALAGRDVAEAKDALARLAAARATAAPVP